MIQSTQTSSVRSSICQSGRKTEPAEVSTILVVDDSAVCRKQTGDVLRGIGFRVLEADDGTSALAIVVRQRVDLIVLDNEMPHMSGLTFLKTLRANQAWARLPVIMLTSTPSRTVAMEDMKYGVRGYLLKSAFSAAEIGTRAVSLLGKPKPAMPPQVTTAPVKPQIAVRPAHIDPTIVPKAPNAPLPRRAAPEPEKQPPVVDPNVIVAPNLVSRDVTLAAAAKMSSAKTLAGVISDVIEKASSARTSMSQIAATIKQDPVFCSRVMQLANSTTSAASRPRSATIDDAVKSIGATAICDLAASVGVFDNFPANRGDGQDLLRCWQHAICVATVMAKIVPRGDTMPAGIPHLIGLCHDLSEILLRQCFPQEFTAAIDFARQAKASITQLLPSVFGVSIAELSAAIMAQMKLPAMIADPIREFCKTTCQPPGTYNSQVVRALAIANYFANALLLTSSTAELVGPILSADCRSVLLSGAKLNGAEIRAESITTTCMLSKLPTGDGAPKAEPLVRSSAKRVGYVRHLKFAELDPLEAALANLCELVMLPTPLKLAELETVHAIVVAAPGTDTVLVSEVVRLRAQCGAESPILYLTGPAGQKFAGTTTAYEEAQYPLSLDRLATFIAALDRLAV